MCEPMSAIFTRERCYWSKLGDSHEQIIQENGLDDTHDPPEIVRCQIIPPEYDYRRPFDEWIFSVDQSYRPDWWNTEWAEGVIREELPKWAKFHFIHDGIHTVVKGMTRIVFGGTVNQSGGECHNHSGGVVNQSGGECHNHSGGVVNQSGGECDNDPGGVVNQSGGECWNYSSGVVNQSGGECYNHSGGVVNQSGGECWNHSGGVVNRVKGSGDNG